MEAVVEGDPQDTRLNELQCNPFHNFLLLFLSHLSILSHADFDCHINHYVNWHINCYINWRINCHINMLTTTVSICLLIGTTTTTTSSAALLNSNVIWWIQMTYYLCCPEPPHMLNLHPSPLLLKLPLWIDSIEYIIVTTIISY